jgi:prepilin-type N-terminal cleavage/methylation domain-containing protein
MTACSPLPFLEPPQPHFQAPHPAGRIPNFAIQVRHSAFSLLELLVVIGIISVLLAALMPAVTSISKSTGRKGAIGNLLSLLEQARALAITGHQNAYVAFATDIAPPVPRSIAHQYSYKAYAVFADDAASSGIIQITKWQKLPMGISFRSRNEPPDENGNVNGTSVTSGSNTITMPFFFAPATSSLAFPYLKFDPTGTIVEPTTPAPMRLVVFEGTATANAEIPTAKEASGEPVRDEIQITKFTGRAKHVAR